MVLHLRSLHFWLEVKRSAFHIKCFFLFLLVLQLWTGTLKRCCLNLRQGRQWASSGLVSWCVEPSLPLEIIYGLNLDQGGCWARGEDIAWSWDKGKQGAGSGKPSEWLGCVDSLISQPALMSFSVQHTSWTERAWPCPSLQDFFVFL